MCTITEFEFPHLFRTMSLLTWLIDSDADVTPIYPLPGVSAASAAALEDAVENYSEHLETLCVGVAVGRDLTAAVDALFTCVDGSYQLSDLFYKGLPALGAGRP